MPPQPPQKKIEKKNDEINFPTPPRIEQTISKTTKNSVVSKR